MSAWIDISRPLCNGLPAWPGDIPFRREAANEIGVEGSDCNTSVLSMSSHTGTHMDAPLHFVPGGLSVDRLDPDTLIGEAYVLDLTGVAAMIEVGDLQGRVPETAKRLLIKTRNSARAPDGVFHTDYVALSAPAAAYLAGCDISLLGIDGCSIAMFDSPGPAHVAYLQGGGAALESINLAQARQGWYDLVCLPLPVQGGDGAPARALIRRKRQRK